MKMSIDVEILDEKICRDCEELDICPQFMTISNLAGLEEDRSEYLCRNVDNCRRMYARFEKRIREDVKHGIEE